MDRRRAAGALLALAACVAYATAAPTASNHTSLDLYDGSPEGCYYNFQHYGEGDRIMTNEPCLNCTCHNRMLMCYLRVCPFTKPIGQDCTIEKRADQCCPIVTCPDVPVDLLTSTTTSPAEYGSTGLGKLDKYGCSLHGKYFPEGSKVPPTPNKPCEHCYCIRNMTTCVMQECTLHVDGCTPIYHKDVCCPVRYSCDHPEDEMPLLDDLSTTVRPTPGFLLTTTTLSPVTQMTQDCIYENQVIPDGALIKTEKACDHCYCMKGDIVCVVQECGTPMENEGKNCTALAPREGVCCPDTYICEGDEPTTGIYGGSDYTTELEQETLTTLSPPRRAGSEGSGYRHEPGYTPPASPASDIEGSGDEQTTLQTILTEDLPESHKGETINEVSTSTEKSHEFIESISTNAPEYDSVTTESNKHLENELQDYIPSTTSDYIPQQNELTTTNAHEEELGSGEEDIISPHDTVPTSSLPAIDESITTVSDETSITTTDSNGIKDHLTTRLLEPTTSAPAVNVEKITHPEEDMSETTTESRLHYDEDTGVKTTSISDEESRTTELNTLRTTSVPITEEDVGKTTVLEKQDTTIPNETQTTKTFDEPHKLQTSTHAFDLDDEAVTTESQDVISNQFGETGSDIDPYHQTTMTASTPLLEEIEKDDIENLPIQSTHAEDKNTTITESSNIPIKESIEKDSLKPDIIDEIIPTNIPTTISIAEDEDITTVEPQTNQDLEYSPEPGDDNKKTTPKDSFTTNIPETSQKTDSIESSQPEQYATATFSPVFEDEGKKITPPATYEPQKAQEESSSPQQYSPTTISSVFENEILQTTTSESTLPEIVDESSEPPKHYPTTSPSHIKDEQTSSEYITVTQKIQENEVEDISEPHQYAPATTLPDQSEESSTDDIPEISHGKVDENISKPQQNDFTTNAPAFEDERKKTTLSDDTIIATSDSQKDQEHGIFEVTSEDQTYSPTTVATFDEKIKEITPSDEYVHHETDIAAITDHKEITTAEPDKGLNTIPSGFMDDEITETPEIEKYSHKPEESTDKKTTVNLSVHKEFVTETEQHTTSMPDTLVSQENQFIFTTESSETDTVENVASTKTYVITEQTTVSTDKFEEDISASTYAYLPSSKSPTTEYQEISTSAIPMILEQTAKSTEAPSYEPSTSSNLDDSISEKHETITTSSPSYISEATTPDNEEIQISNEPRIPGEGDCLLNGVTYRNESAVPSSNKCLSGCKCSSSIIKCDPIICSPPPEYMDNCETTYDSPDSCCPTYVCDHRRTETMPPQSHSQMSGTDTPLVSPTKCNGDDCTISEEYKPTLCDSGNCSPQDENTQIGNDSKQPDGTDTPLISPIKCNGDECTIIENNKPSSCDSNSCIPQDEISHAENVPEQPVGTDSSLVSPVKCSGDECTISEDTKPTLCDSGSCSPQGEISHSEKSPQQPIVVDNHEKCTGNECKASGSSELICTEENGCVTTPPCEGTECKITSDVMPPHKCVGNDCDLSVATCNGEQCGSEPDVLPQEQDSIEKLCTEKSCKRKDDHKTEQQPPQKCSGPECTLPVSDVKQTTSAYSEITQKEFELKTQSTDGLDSTTENIEKLTESQTTMFDISTSPSVKITQEPGHRETVQSDTDFEPQLTTTLPDKTIPDSDKKDVVTDHEPVTDNSDKVITDQISTDTPLPLPDIDVTEKQDVSNEIADQKNTVNMGKGETTETINKESESDITTEQQSSKLPEPEILKNTPTSNLDGIESYTEPSIADTSIPTKTSTMSSIINESEPLDVTKIPVESQPEEITTELYKVTELPLLEKDQEASTMIAEEITSTPLKTYDEDVSKVTDIPVSIDSLDMTTLTVNIVEAETGKPHASEITTASEEHLTEGTTSKSTDEMIQDTKSTEGVVDNEVIHQSPEEVPATETYIPEASDFTKSPSTTLGIQEISTDRSKPIDSKVQEDTQYTKESDIVESTTKLREDIGMGSELQEPSHSTESEETTQTSVVTKPSTSTDTEEYSVTPEVTKVKTTQVFDESSDDELLLSTIGPQEDTKIDITTSHFIDEASTEPPKYDYSERITTTKSSASSDIYTTTLKVPTEVVEESSTESLLHSTIVPQTDIEKYASTSNIINEVGTESYKLDDSEKISTTKSPDSYDIEKTTVKVTAITDADIQTVTQTSQDITKPVKHESSSEESQLPEHSSTSQPNVVPELTTSSVSKPDSKITEPIVTEKQEQSQPTEIDTEFTTQSIIRITPSITSVPIEDIVTSIRDQDIATESSLDLDTTSELHLDATDSSEKPNTDNETTRIDNISVEPVATDSPKEKETTEPEQLDDITLNSILTSTAVSKLQENTITEAPELIITTLRSDDDSKEIATKQEQQKTTVSSNEEQPIETLEESTGKPSILETSTQQALGEAETKLPDDLEFEKGTQKPTDLDSAPSPTESSIEVTSKSTDRLEMELPNDNRDITKTSEKEEKITEKPIEIVEETKTTQFTDISTITPESVKPEDIVYETGTTPSKSSTSIEKESTPQLVDKEFSKPATETTTTFANLLTESTGFIDEITTETTKKESSKPDSTDHTKIESSSSKDGTEVEIHTETPELSTIQKTSTSADNFLFTDVKEIVTEVPKLTTEENITTKEPLIMDTETINESVTESEQIKTSQLEELEPSPAHTTTESAEQITKEQDQEKDDNVDVVTKNYEQTSTSLPVTSEITENAIDTNTNISEIVTSQPSRSTEKYQDSEYVTTFKQEYFETTTSANIEEGNVLSVETDKPVTDIDQQKINVVTESQSVPMDTATTKQEDSITSKTESPETNPTTSFESQSTTLTPLINEASTTPEQTTLSSIVPHISEDSQPITTVVSNDEISSTPKAPEDDGQTDQVTETTQKPFQPEPETSIPTTVKTEEISTASPLVEKVSKQPHTPEISATEQPKPISTEDQPTDDIGQDEDPSMPPTGATGYGTDPDYMEEDQTFGPGTCRYGGKVYVSAQQIPRDDPCDFCFCFRSDIICLQQSCPPPIHGCHEEPISGFCCPRYECPVSMATTVNVTTTTTTTTTTLPPHFPVHSYKGSAQKRGCLIKGHTYKVGEVVRASSGPCLHCTCGGDGQMKCDPKQCTPEPMLRQMIAAAVSAKRRR